MFIRRLGPLPRSSACSGGSSCPDILELSDGDFAVIGADITADAARNLPPGCGCGFGEKIVKIPRRTLVLARGDIPDAV